ncbi:MAG: ribosome silencing factor, partial [Clostridiales bacterium]
TVVAEYFLLMTVKNNRQAQAMADYLEEETEKIGYGPLRTEGYQEGVWVLLDYGSLIVHIFQDAERKYYNLERLWGDAPQVVY